MSETFEEARFVEALYEIRKEYATRLAREHVPTEADYKAVAKVRLAAQRLVEAIEAVTARPGLELTISAQMPLPPDEWRGAVPRQFLRVGLIYVECRALAAAAAATEARLDAKRLLLEPYAKDGSARDWLVREALPNLFRATCPGQPDGIFVDARGESPAMIFVRLCMAGCGEDPLKPTAMERAIGRARTRAQS